MTKLPTTKPLSAVAMADALIDTVTKRDACAGIIIGIQTHGGTTWIMSSGDLREIGKEIRKTIRRREKP